MATLLYREAALAPVESQEDWRTLDFSHAGVDSIPELSSGGGYAYKHLYTSRFIIWYAKIDTHRMRPAQRTLVTLSNDKTASFKLFLLTFNFPMIRQIGERFPEI